jgi:hypothetical protein
MNGIGPFTFIMKCKPWHQYSNRDMEHRIDTNNKRDTITLTMVKQHNFRKKFLDAQYRLLFLWKLDFIFHCV